MFSNTTQSHLLGRSSVTTIAIGAAAWLLGMATPHVGRLIARRRSVRPITSTPEAAPATITTIDDPDGAMRLIGVCGELDALAVARLEAVIDDTDDMSILHLDLTAARLVAPPSMHHVEAVLEGIERRGIRLRVVGLDPEHPALAPQSLR